MARTRDAGEDDRALAAGALDDLVGAVLVLDHQLRIRLATASAGVVLGFTPPIGASAATLLCGDRPKKPFAEALAEGRPFQAIIPRPGPASGSAAPAMVRARSVPIGGDGERGDDDRPPGWLVYLAAVTAGDDEPVEFHGMWTRDPRMKEAFRIIGKVAGEDAPVLIRGETGTGKELVAHALHAASSRRAGPFRAINCAALPGNLLESELFGHARGAFTGAVKDTPGHILLADGGTLFLDEIAEMPLELQAKLLRVVETRTVIPVGGRDPIPVDLRLVSATHRALRAEVEAGRFRADLMYRLRVIPIRLPPLRERPGDVQLLSERIVAEFNTRGRRRVERIAAAAQLALERYEWPGNVRELRNVVAYAFAIGDGPVLELSDLPDEVAAAGTAAGEAVVVADTTPAPLVDREHARIADALARTGGNRDRAAKLLGLSRVTLWRRMKALGL